MPDDLKKLRDEFAGQIICASLSHEKNMICLGIGDSQSVQEMADDAYFMADAMLRARAKSDKI